MAGRRCTLSVMNRRSEEGADVVDRCTVPDIAATSSSDTPTSLRSWPRSREAFIDARETSTRLVARRLTPCGRGTEFLASALKVVIGTEPQPKTNFLRTGAKDRMLKATGTPVRIVTTRSTPQTRLALTTPGRRLQSGSFHHL